jgi:hypothetical protein
MSDVSWTRARCSARCEAGESTIAFSVDAIIAAKLDGKRKILGFAAVERRDSATDLPMRRVRCCSSARSIGSPAIRQIC